MTKLARLTALVLFSFVSIVSAQLPLDYYDLALEKVGEELKVALNEIIDSNKEFPYTSGSTDTWDILKESDKDPNNSDNIILVYTSRSVNAAQEYNSGSGWSREHVWAKSRGDFGTTIGTGTDLHNLKPADVSVNSTRSNRSFFESSQEVVDNGVFSGSYVGDGFTFEPRDDVKGDIARIMFYMSVRYEGHNGDLDLELTEQMLSPSDKSSLHGVLTELLQWHEDDPVDDFEKHRNDIIYQYQGNRNPFIDHPEWVQGIWSVNTNMIKKPMATELDGDEFISIYNLIGQSLFKGKINEISREINITDSGLFIVSRGGNGTLMSGKLLQELARTD